MRFVLFVNNDEAEANGDEMTWDDVEYEVGELLRSGHYEVEYMTWPKDDE